MKTNRDEGKSIESAHNLSSQIYHATKANMNQGDLIDPGFNSNYGKIKKASNIFPPATLDITFIPGVAYI